MSDGSGVLSIGALVGDTYEVTRLLGRGGMGEVWLAKHRRLPGKQVAIKVLHTRGHALAPEALARFRREAEIATRIGHPNIVEVHDFNTLASGEPYLVLEFLAGESLAQRLRYGPVSLDEATKVIRQVSSALDASHSIGVVHRDLKPDNIFLLQTQMGLHVKVLDFGISKIADSTTVQTQDAVLVGTPQYMSPEQAVGANKDVGPQTDIFALGSIAYEMLAGRPPFAAESIAKIVFQIAYEPHTPLAQLKADLPPRVVQAVEMALLKDRNHRYKDVAQFAADFSGEAMTRPPMQVPMSEVSGVARPGTESPESLMMARTAAPSQPPLVTPSAPVATPMKATDPSASPVNMNVAPTPASVAAAPELPVADPKRSKLPLILGAVVLLAGIGFGVKQFAGADQTKVVPTLVPMPAVVDAGVAEVVVVDAGEAVAEVDAGMAEEPVDAGTAVATPVRPTKRNLTKEEQAALKEVEKLIATDPLGAMRRGDMLRRTGSDAMVAALNVAVTRAACAAKDPQAAVTFFQRLETAADKREAKTFCAKRLPNLEL